MHETERPYERGAIRERIGRAKRDFFMRKYHHVGVSQNGSSGLGFPPVLIWGAHLRSDAPRELSHVHTQLPFHTGYVAHM